MIEKDAALRHTNQQFSSPKPSILSNNNPRILNPEHYLPFFPLLFSLFSRFALLYQLRFIAADLADTAVFSAALFIAAGTGLFISKFKINKKYINTFEGLAAIALIPWAARAFIAMPRLFVSGEAIGLDSFLLNFDRNNFVSLLPFYWTAASTFLSVRSRLFLRAAVIIDALLLITVAGIARVSDLAIYRLPIVMIITLAGIVFFQALALLFSLPPELKIKKGEKTVAVVTLLLLVFAGGSLFLKPSQQRAAQKGGGLLEPKLFSFDFSQVLRLDTEISMKDDLVLIVKKDPDDNHILMRRSVMSGYSKKQGFYRMEEIDEKIHPLRLPSRPALFPQEGFKMARQVRQEYFIVNFDAAAFIGMKEPLEIIPYENWDSSSFKSAYLTESLTSDAVYEQYSGSTFNEGGGVFWPGSDDLGLSEKEYALYTAYGNDDRIRELAEKITAGYENYGDKVEVVYEWLKYGDFRYSLKPGIAPDGDQLAWFLFQSKKGYCSYYAFAMTLLLRSIGIPARIAAGFFLDPESGTFDYYQVRSDMAHAWVEVPFPGYGWIEFDPTTENLAEGEEFRFSAGVDPQLFERLMREILENRSRLRAKTGNEIMDNLWNAHSLAGLSAMLFKKILLPLLIISLIIIFILLRCGFWFLYVMRHNKRGRAVCLWKHARRRLMLAGLGYPGLKSRLSESEWASSIDAVVKGAYSLYLGAAAARFAPEYRDDDFIAMQNTYRLFSVWYRKVPLWRRLLAWVIPPLALMLKNINTIKHVSILLFVFLLVSIDGRAQEDALSSDSELSGGRYADELFNRASESEYSEYWERAIELYREGRNKFPDDLRFPLALGNLFFNRSLYSLAWDEYRIAEQLMPFEPFILQRLAHTAGYLNLDKTSVTYLERLLLINPDNMEAISYLGWMYYKVHRLDDGERLISAALERFGDDADLAMTLGTIYSDMYRYDDGKYWYEKAIALGAGARSFTAVAHYNLSILESRFYHYDLSMDEANASIDAQNRASGLLARGELLMRRLDIEEAYSDFQTAREIDQSPLAKVNLAQAYQISGRLEEARLYALDCLKSGDQSWMAYYGIDPVRYKRDIHEILYKTYSGLAKAERFLPWGTVGGVIRSAVKTVSYRFYYAVHHKLYQKYSLASGDAYDIRVANGHPPLDQYIQYYNAFETYPRRALVYLNKARDFETAIIPASAGSYYLEESILRKDTRLTARALDALDPVWERDLISHCHREFALRGSASFGEELFAFNRGALLQAGISLPLEIRFNNADGKKFMRTLAKAGFVKSNQARFTLDITINAAPVNGAPPSAGFTVFCEIGDSEGVVKPLRHVIPLRSMSHADICAFARVLGGLVFRVEG
jgi:transglutaminase-like putative cysteine protease/tetratricopeptide (TPR) repeat protein